MKEHKNKVILHKCLRCLWNWAQRGIEHPRRCPKCGSAYWDTKRRKEIKEGLK